MILTLDIPESLAEQIRTRAETSGESVNRFTEAWLADTFAVDQAETIEGIREGLEDADAGREKPLAESLSEMLGFLESHTATNRSKAE